MPKSNWSAILSMLQKNAALEFAQTSGAAFIHPFDDVQIIEGQATLALEILEQQKENIDFVFIPIGGGGLASGISTVFKNCQKKRS